MMTGDGAGGAPGPGVDGVDVSPEARSPLSEDGDRPAHDLNDTVIRRMFTVSLDLHAALSRIEHGAGDGYAAEKIRDAIIGLDQAIDDIRNGVVTRGRFGGLSRSDT